MRRYKLDYLFMFLGAGLMAVAITSVFDASGLVTGGFSGIAIILKDWSTKMFGWGIPLWLTNFVLNLPLIIAAAKIRGFSFVKKGIVGELSLSFWLAVLPAWNLAGDDLLLASVYGGLIQGVGIGLVFLGQGTTGGTDMLAGVIQKYLPHYSIAQIMQVIDGLIVLLGMYVFGIRKALYAIIAVYLVTKVSDGIIEGMKFSKEAFIITDRPEEIADMILSEIQRGVTGLQARGMYSGREKTMLFCVVSKKEIVQLKERINEIDPGAFVIVSDAREVHGEGFIEKK